MTTAESPKIAGAGTVPSDPRRLRICYVFQDEYPWDVRVEKFVSALADRGHHTVIVSRNRRGLARRESLRPGVEVQRLPAGITPIDRSLMNFPAFFSPWWVHAIANTVRREACDVILVRDLPLAAAGVLAGRMTGRPVLMDMAENYPAMIQATWDLHGPKPWDYLVRNPSLLRRLERRVLPALDGVFVVSEPSRERVAEMTAHRVPVWVVENTPRLDVVSQSVPSQLADRIAAHRGLRLLYVGNMDAKRGLDIVVRALPSLKTVDPHVLVVIVGKGVMEARLRGLASELQVEQNLLLAGWVDQKEVPSIISASDIGLIPHLLNEHTDTTIPNKIYDYMAQARPVVVTQCRTLKQIVESCDCGRVYTDRDPEAFARAVATLTDESTRRALGAAGRRAVEQRYRWDRDAETLLAALNSLVGARMTTTGALTQARP